MSCRCSGTLSRRVSKQGSELLGACRAHRPLADAHVLHAKSSPALAPRFIACNTTGQFMILRAISIARNDCTQETARSRRRDAGKDQIGPKNWENAIEGPSLPCNFTPMGLPTQEEDHKPQATHRHRHAGPSDRRHQSMPPTPDGAPLALSTIRSAYPWLRQVFTEGGYAGPKLEQALAGQV